MTNPCDECDMPMLFKYENCRVLSKRTECDFYRAFKLTEDIKRETQHEKDMIPPITK